MDNMILRKILSRVTKYIPSKSKEFFFSPFRYFLCKYLNVDFSLFGIQKAIIKKLSPHKKGFFLEMGAADGIRQSNTSLLEFKYKWKGLLIEPNPYLFNRCLRYRKNSFSLNSFISSSQVGVLANLSGGLQNTSTTDYQDKTIAPVLKLNDIFKSLKCNRINFFSLDVEGAEFDVLKSIDFTKITIEWLLIEIQTKKSLNQVKLLLKPYYEIEDTLSIHDYLFKLKV
jgi:FkbM family methyltransferase